MYKRAYQSRYAYGLFQSLLSISFLVVQSALNTLGSDEVAAYTAAYKMDSMMMQILSGFGTAISTFTAQNYGHKAYNRIRKGAKETLKITVLLNLIVAIFAHFLEKNLCHYLFKIVKIVLFL